MEEEDRGGYMCQLNTDPMKSQVSVLGAGQRLASLGVVDCHLILSLSLDGFLGRSYSP